MKLDNLKDLFVEQLRDLYSAESQIQKALPKMEKAATHPALKQAYLNHLEQTKVQANRLQQIFDDLDMRPSGKTCKGMEGIIQEGDEIIKENADPEVRDAGLIAAAQKVEHYEISAYGTARTMAEMLDQTEAAELLDETLEEEKAADETLTDIAESIMSGEEAANEEDEAEATGELEAD